MNSKQLRRLRQQAFENQNRSCFYCRYPIWDTDGCDFARVHGVPPRLAKYLKCTAEHLIARQESGQNTVTRCVTTADSTKRPTRLPTDRKFRASSYLDGGILWQRAKVQRDGTQACLLTDNSSISGSTANANLDCPAQGRFAGPSLRRSWEMPIGCANRIPY